MCPDVWGSCFISRRPSGVPEQDVCSGLVSYYKKQEEYMRIQLKKLQKENAGLALKVQTGRENITHTEQRVAAGVEEWRVREQNHFSDTLTFSLLYVTLDHKIRVSFLNWDLYIICLLW